MFARYQSGIYNYAHIDQYVVDISPGVDYYENGSNTVRYLFNYSYHDSAWNKTYHNSFNVFAIDAQGIYIKSDYWFPQSTHRVIQKKYTWEDLIDYHTRAQSDGCTSELGPYPDCMPQNTGENISFSEIFTDNGSIDVWYNTSDIYSQINT
ncbi:MAG: hypothetical protein U9Q15_03300 [Patescibacteria group bacterium]|nr:hypothetical protein [Patescibacteria group bacterium]